MDTAKPVGAGRRRLMVGMLVLGVASVCLSSGNLYFLLRSRRRPPEPGTIRARGSARRSKPPLPPATPDPGETAAEHLLMLVGRQAPGEARNVIDALGIDVNVCGYYGWTALHHAARWDRAREADELLAAGADVDRSDGSGTALAVAAANGSAGVARVLLAHGADPDSPGFGGMTPVHEACQSGQTDLARLLVSAGGDVNAATISGETPLLYAARNGDAALAGFLLESGAETSPGAMACESPVCAAAVINPDLAATLVGAGAPVDAWAAAALGDLPRLEALLSAGVPVDRRDPSGRTPLHWATRCGQEATVRALLLRGADARAKGPRRWAPLHYAAFARDTPTPPRSERYTRDGQPGLWQVQDGTSRRCTSVLGVLLDQVDDVSPVTRQNLTPLDLAAFCGNQAALDLLEARGARRTPGCEGVSGSLWDLYGEDTAILLF